MRAILIDPEKQTFTEIQLKGDDYREINTILCCRSHTLGAHLNGSIEKGFGAVPDIHAEGKVGLGFHRGQIRLDWPAPRTIYTPCCCVA